MLAAAKIFEVGIGTELEWWLVTLPLAIAFSIGLAVFIVFGATIAVGFLIAFLGDKISTANRRRKFRKFRKNIRNK